MKSLTIGFTTHRPEMVALTEASMAAHDAVFLEEPPTSGFTDMLACRLAIDDYLEPIDLEYPEYSRRMCRMMRRLNKNGIALLQVEPFMEELISIHSFFAAGHTPSEIKSQSLRRAVYESERNTTGALLSYYRTAMTGSFDEALSATKTFARYDAARFRLRDLLRSIAISNRIGPYRYPYVEAGVIHYGLYLLLRRELKSEFRVIPVFETGRALKQLKQNNRHGYGPGDQLTLLYIFHPRLSIDEPRTTLCAARALIFAKLIAKEEISEAAETFPHLLDEAETIATVNRLSLEDCRRIFPVVRRMSTESARAAVNDYLGTSFQTAW